MLDSQRFSHFIRRKFIRSFEKRSLWIRFYNIFILYKCVGTLKSLNWKRVCPNAALVDMLDQYTTQNAKDPYDYVVVLLQNGLNLPFRLPRFFFFLSSRLMHREWASKNGFVVVYYCCLLLFADRLKKKYKKTLSARALSAFIDRYTMGILLKCNAFVQVQHTIII